MLTKTSVAEFCQLENSPFPSCSDVDAPFARWTKDQVCDWLQEQGLGLYVNMARVWISSGQTLLQASQQDLERVSSCRISGAKLAARLSTLS